MKLKIFTILIALFISFSLTLNAQEKQDKLLSETTFSGMKFRNIGQAFMSGRIADIAIHPENQNIWYVAVGSGGVWKTIDIRIEKEKELSDANKDIDFPGWDALDTENMQQKPAIYLTVLDQNNDIVRKINGPYKKGMHRVNWDLRFSSPNPVSLKKPKKSSNGLNFMAAPGKYKVFLSKEVDGIVTILSDTVDFDVEQLYKGALQGAKIKEVALFWKEVSDFQAKLAATYKVIQKTKAKASAMQRAVKKSNNKDTALTKQLHDLTMRISNLEKKIYGSPSKREVGEKNKPTINDRICVVITGVSYSTYGPTPTHKQSFDIAKKEYKTILNEITKIVEHDVTKLEEALKKAGAPYIEGQGLPKE